MKKLLTLLACCSLSAPSFGVDWIRDRIYTSSSYGMLGVNYDLGYHCTDSVKISFGPIVKLVINEEILDAGLMAKLHYHYKFENTDITPLLLLVWEVLLKFLYQDSKIKTWRNFFPTR